MTAAGQCTGSFFVIENGNLPAQIDHLPAKSLSETVLPATIGIQKEPKWQDDPRERKAAWKRQSE